MCYTLHFYIYTYRYVHICTYRHVVYLFILRLTHIWQWVCSCEPRTCLWNINLNALFHSVENRMKWSSCWCRCCRCRCQALIQHWASHIKSYESRVIGICFWSCLALAYKLCMYSTLHTYHTQYIYISMWKYTQRLVHHSNHHKQYRSSQFWL